MEQLAVVAYAKLDELASLRAAQTGQPGEGKSKLFTSSGFSGAVSLSR